MLHHTSEFKAICFPKLSHQQWGESLSLHDEFASFLLYVASIVFNVDPLDLRFLNCNTSSC